MPTARFCRFVIVIAWLWVPQSWARQTATVQQIELFAYHNAPPFLVNIDTNSGLNADLVKALQPLVGEGYRLTLTLVSRPELNQRLAAHQPTIVLWTHPSWYGEQASQLLWAAPLFSDRDVLVGRVSEKRQPFPLDGATFAALQGYSYPGLNERVQAKTLQRVDSSSDKENLLKLADGQVDVVMITRSSFLYFAKQPQFIGKFHVVGQPYDAYRRQILLTAHYRDFLPVLQQALATLEQSSAWQERLAIYGLKAD